MTASALAHAASADPAPHDRALVDACVAGAGGAWAALVQTFGPGVRAAIRRCLERHVGYAADAVVEDLEANLFLGLVVDDFRKLRGFRGQSSVATWLKVMAVNATVDHLRRQWPTVPVGPGEPFDLPQPGPGVEEAMHREALFARLRAMWATLPEADAQFVELYFVQELPFETIAEQLGTTVPALYTRKNRIRKRLLALAEEQGLLDGVSEIGG